MLAIRANCVFNAQTTQQSTGTEQHACVLCKRCASAGDDTAREAANMRGRAMQARALTVVFVGLHVSMRKA